MTPADSEVEFPLTLVDEEGQAAVYHDRGHLQTNLEWFDSDREPGFSLTDALGRPVRLRMVAMGIEILELASTARPLVRKVETKVKSAANSPIYPSRLSYCLAWAVSITFGLIQPVVQWYYFLLRENGRLTVPRQWVIPGGLSLYLILTLLAAGVAGCFWKGPARQLGMIGVAPCFIYPLLLLVNPPAMVLVPAIAAVTFGAYYYASRIFQRKVKEA